jgi:outer membrane protein assembly factor BamB
MSTPVIINDTLYVANYLKLYAFSSAGTFLWSKPMANLQPYPPATDGKTLFLISAPLTTAFYSLHAVDIKTRNVLWTVPMGYNPPGGMFVWNNLLVYTDGAQKLVALNKSTGAQQWAKTNIPYKQFIYDDKNIYIFNHSSSDMLLAFDLNTGAQVWKFPYPFNANESLYMFNKKIFFMAWNGSKRYMNCVSTSTGDTLWRKQVDINASFSTPIVTDKDVFYFKSGLVDLTPRILRFNAETFTAKDSFVVNGVEVGQPRIIMRSGTIY